MKTRTRQKRPNSQRRRQILDAALQCFLEHGLDAATIEQIRAASGASSGSIYHHFGSKEAIALTLYLEGVQSYHAALLAEFERQRTPEGAIRALVAAHLQYSVDDPSRSLYLTRVATADLSGETAERVTEANRAFFRSVHAWLAPFIERGEVASLPLEAYVPVILGPASLFLRHWLAGRMTLDVGAAVATFADAAWKALKPPATAARAIRPRKMTSPRRKTQR